MIKWLIFKSRDDRLIFNKKIQVELLPDENE